MKLSSVLGDRQQKYFSVEHYRQQYKLKINSSIALEEGEHRELKDILKKVMIKGVIAQNRTPDRRISQQNEMAKSQNVYDAILARSKRSRMGG